MRIDVITLVPEMFEGPLRESIIGRARERGLVEIALHDLQTLLRHDRELGGSDRLIEGQLRGDARGGGRRAAGGL